MDVQRNLEANMEKRTKDTFGPPPGIYVMFVCLYTCSREIQMYNTPQCGKGLSAKEVYN